jgi:hypothetical protein
MIGLAFLAVIAFWAMVVFYTCKFCKQTLLGLGLTRIAKPASLFLFPVLFVLPVADDIIGQWQFQQLCEREATINLDPSWENVTRAGKTSIPLVPEPEGYIVPIHGTKMEYWDPDGNKIFLSFTRFRREPGALRKMLWDGGFSNNDFCKPEELYDIYKKIDMNTLLKNGENK